MGNNIIMLPVKGGTKTSPVNQFTEDMENLLYVADAIIEDDLIEDTDADGTVAENWRRYRKIARMIFAANAIG